MHWTLRAEGRGPGAGRATIRTVAILAIALIAILPLQSAAQAPPADDGTVPSGPSTADIVIIDFQSALSGSDAFAAVQEEAARLRDRFREEFAVLERQLRDVERQLGVDRDQIPAEEFNDRRRAFEERVVAAQRAAQERRAALDRATRDATERIRERLLTIVSTIATERGASLVVAREMVVLVNVDIDITQEAVTRLNEALPTVSFEMTAPELGGPSDDGATEPPAD